VQVFAENSICFSHGNGCKCSYSYSGSNINNNAAAAAAATTVPLRALLISSSAAKLKIPALAQVFLVYEGTPLCLVPQPLAWSSFAVGTTAWTLSNALAFMPQDATPCSTDFGTSFVRLEHSRDCLLLWPLQQPSASSGVSEGVSEQVSEWVYEQASEQASEPVLDQVWERGSAPVSGQTLVLVLQAPDSSAFAKHLQGHGCQFRNYWHIGPCTFPQSKCQLPSSSLHCNGPLHNGLFLRNHTFP